MSLLFLVFACSSSFALSIDVTPQEVVPGDVILLSVAGSSRSVEASFRKQNINFFPAGDDKLIALIPLDVNTSPDSYKLSVHDGQSKKSVTIRVKSYNYRTINLTVSEGKVTLSPENEKRVAREYELQRKIWQKITPQVWNGQFVKPVDSEISSEYGVRRIMNKKKTSIHKGADFRGTTGTPVQSINSGTVVLSEELFYSGNTLVIDHGMGLYSVYMHLSKVDVLKGDVVSKGEGVGQIGMSGRATGPHLHLSVKLGGVSINPESLFKLKL